MIGRSGTGRCGGLQPDRLVASPRSGEVVIDIPMEGRRTSHQAAIPPDQRDSEQHAENA